MFVDMPPDLASGAAFPDKSSTTETLCWTKIFGAICFMTWPRPCQRDPNWATKHWTQWRKYKQICKECSEMNKLWSGNDREMTEEESGMSGKWQACCSHVYAETCVSLRVYAEKCALLACPTLTEFGQTLTEIRIARPCFFWICVSTFVVNSLLRFGFLQLGLSWKVFNLVPKRRVACVRCLTAQVPWGCLPHARFQMCRVLKGPSSLGMLPPPAFLGDTFPRAPWPKS